MPTGSKNPYGSPKGSPEAGHPSLDHPWCASDSDRGIAWGVLTTPCMENLVGVVRGQCVEEEIGCPRYLIGATGEGAVRLRQEPQKPLPRRQLIFLHSNNDILAWLLANHGQDPLNLLVVESRRKNREDRHQENVRAWSKVVLNAPGPPRGVMVPLVLLVHPDPPWSTFSVKFEKLWI